MQTALPIVSTHSQCTERSGSVHVTPRYMMINLQKDQRCSANKVIFIATT
jgi:hypothetical protein